MANRISVLVLAALLLALTPLQAREPKTPDSPSHRRSEAGDKLQPHIRAPGRHGELSDPRAPRRLSDNPYSLKSRPSPALNSPYSRRGRSMSIYRNEQGRAMGYSIRRPDGRVQYREFQGRGSRRGLPHAWQ